MKKKGRAVERALETKDAIRLTSDVPLITDVTELITPEVAEKMLNRNKHNRPINWNKVDQFIKVMKEGKWKFHAQGIILDGDGNLLTGQKRLCAIMLSGISLHMRVSRGSPSDTAPLIDRGITQSSRDLGSRGTGRKHSPSEATITRGILALRGNIKPSLDDIANVIIEKDKSLGMAIEQTRRIKKTKPLLMVLAAICSYDVPEEIKLHLFGRAVTLSAKLEPILTIPADKCWNRGAAFTLAMKKAQEVVCAEAR